MLIRFSVSNFLSINDKIEFSCEATREANHRERVARGPFPWLKILPATAIYGPNGSGKSNLVKAIEFARNLIVVGTGPTEPIRRKPFKLLAATTENPSRFSFEFLTERESVFRYEFSITGERVESETLTELKSTSEKVWFERDVHSYPADDQFRFPYLSRREFSADERQFVHFVARGTRANQLFLREALDRNLQHFKDVFNWFANQLVVLHPHTRIGPLEIRFSEQEELREFASQALQAADTGIVRISSEEVPSKSVDIPEGLWEDLKKSFKVEGQGTLLINPDGKRYGVYFRNGELRVYRLITFHRDEKGGEVKFELSEESDGTLRLIDFIPGLFAISRNRLPRVFIIDEIDRSLHPLLTEWFVKSFLHACHPRSRAQLLFTCHSPHLFDQRLLRRDEIWLVEKTETGATEIESLSDYRDVRIDTDIRKGYLHGIFTGYPNLRNLTIHPVTEEEERKEHQLHG